jgi:hypothetical protein
VGPLGLSTAAEHCRRKLLLCLSVYAIRLPWQHADVVWLLLCSTSLPAPQSWGLWGPPAACRPPLHMLLLGALLPGPLHMPSLPAA